MADYKNITNFLFEVGQSSYVKNTGWSLIKADQIPSISDFSYRSAVIALLLAELEKFEDTYKLAMAALFHKMHKVRLGDRHKVSANYLNYPPEVKDKIRQDQLSLLGNKLAGKFKEVFNLSEKEKVIVKDAGQLELALEAREYLDKGYKKAQIWLDRIEKVLRTDSAKKVFEQIKKTHSCEWWQDLKKEPQTKKGDYTSRV